MKKIILMMMAAGLVMSISACGGKDGEEKSEENETKMQEKIKNAEIGDYITYGSYEQDDDESNGQEPIEWCVIDKQEGKILVISKYGLDAKMFNEEDELTTWEDSSLRTWLNDEFLKEAFNDNERANILRGVVTADKNPEYGTSEGDDVKDSVFLLSILEVNKYFHSKDELKCKPTEYADFNGAYTSDREGYEGNCIWWLRTMGYYGRSASCIDDEGKVNAQGRNVICDDYAVRPAMWIDTKTIYA